MDKWRDFLGKLNEHERWLAQEVLRFVQAEMQLAGTRSQGNSHRVTDAHLRLDAHAERLDAHEQAIDDILGTLAQMAMDASARQAQCHERQAGGGNEG